MILLVRIFQVKFWFIFLLPPRIALAIMHLASRIIYLIVRNTPIKTIVARNIKLVMPDLPAREVADQLIKNTSLSILEVLCIPYFKKAHYERTFKYVGLELLDKALAEKKGVIILTMHYGNYESSGNAVAHLGYRVTNVLRDDKNDPLMAIVNHSRRIGGIKLVNTEEDNMFTEAAKALERNEIVGILIDTGALESRHEYIDFLDKKVPVATGWLTLAQRVACPVLSLITVRQGNVNHVIIFEADHVTRDNRQTIIQKFSRGFEKFVREHPEYWLMFFNEYETKRMVNGE
ncbi:MAG: lysophospholipid acyltransferase family protein [Candidatus Margulisiibacteriota bacterium]